jgi:hypothetical protein
MSQNDDRSWMRMDRSNPVWQEKFQKYIHNTFDATSTAKCPCAKCRCMVWKTRREVYHRWNLLTSHFSSRRSPKVNMNFRYLEFSRQSSDQGKNDGGVFVLQHCWRSLMLIFNHQLLHEKEWNEPHSIFVGFDSNEFHELCCSHLFWRIFNISLYKSTSSDEIEHTIVKSSLRRSKRTYHLLYLKFRRESPMDMTRKILEDSRTITKQEF